LTEPEKGIKVVYAEPSPIVAQTEEKTRTCPLLANAQVSAVTCQGCQFNGTKCQAPIPPNEF